MKAHVPADVHAKWERPLAPRIQARVHGSRSPTPAITKSTQWATNATRVAPGDTQPVANRNTECTRGEREKIIGAATATQGAVSRRESLHVSARASVQAADLITDPVCEAKPLEGPLLVSSLVAYLWWRRWMIKRANYNPVSPSPSPESPN